MVVGAFAFLAPVFVQVALTLGLVWWGGMLRTRSLRSGEVASRDIALGEPNWPRQTTQVINAYHNQLELPVLFYVAMLLALLTGHPTLGIAILGWLFVAARLFHALVHVTTNDVRRRGAVFGVGLILVTLIWIFLTVELITA
jgi:hypothetical protein